jgi:hypothetical protein
MKRYLSVLPLLVCHFLSADYYTEFTKYDTRLDKKKPFTGMFNEDFITVQGWVSIKYLPLKNGRRDGVEVLIKDH